MMRAVPAMMAMPMMLGVQTQARAASFESPQQCDCNDLEDRLNDLDRRVDALDLRMQTIQRAVEIQTRILEELKAQGTIG
ncbi:MAG: hypothetical protein KDA59_03105, partial [Planctomycetales bacterium]|nr:hypothetical protein [Planctomycetales bacterium]